MDSPKPAAAVRLKIDQRWLGENREGRERENFIQMQVSRVLVVAEVGAHSRGITFEKMRKKTLIVLCCE